MKCFAISMIVSLSLTLVIRILANYPLIDVSSNMRIVLLPHDMPIGTPFYRLKASDSDANYPLTFEVIGNVGNSLVTLTFLGCSQSDSVCQSDVTLQKGLDKGRSYEFELRVTDTMGDFTQVKAAIVATEGTAFGGSFGGPSTLTVPENTNPGMLLTSFIVTKNELNSRTVLLEIRDPSSKIELRQRLLSHNRVQGFLYLAQKLDYENEPWFTFQLLTMNGRTDTSVDTRNLLIFPIIVGVEDIQDTPPRFTSFTPYLELSSTLQKGDLLTVIHAEDGDRKNPRQIRYGIISDSNPFATFFELSPIKGELRLKRNFSELVEIARPLEHIKLSLVAEEMDSPDNFNRQPFNHSESRTVQNITLWINQSATVFHRQLSFMSTKYIGEIEENALPGTLVQISPAKLNRLTSLDITRSTQLTLSGKNGDTIPFEIIPSEGFGNFTFEIRVLKSDILDYELIKSFKFQVQAALMGTQQLTSAEIEIHLRDQNDCSPEFSRLEYVAEIPENSRAGTKIIRVMATDCDTGLNGQIRYTKLPGSEPFHLDPITGDISVDKPELLDRETQSEFRFDVTAIDGGSPANIATVLITIKLTDVNDCPPVFESKSYQLILNAELSGLKWPVRVKAQDADTPGTPASDIRYSVVDDLRFQIDHITGDLRLKSPLPNSNPSRSPYFGSFRVRAYDLGSPSLGSETTIEVYVEDVLSQEIQFLFPTPVDRVRRQKLRIEEMLSSLVGGRALITKIRPYESARLEAEDSQVLSEPSSSYAPEIRALALKTETEAQVREGEGEKTVVITTVQAPLTGKSRTFDIELLRALMNADDPRPPSTISTPPPEVLRAESYSLYWLLIALIILLIIFFIIFVSCVFCPCCWLYRTRLQQSEVIKSEKIIQKKEAESSKRIRKKHSRVFPEEPDDMELYHRFPRAREAWSGDEGGRTQFQRYNSRLNNRGRDIEVGDPRMDIRTLPDAFLLRQSDDPRWQPQKNTQGSFLSHAPVQRHLPPDPYFDAYSHPGGGGAGNFVYPSAERWRGGHRPDSPSHSLPPPLPSGEYRDTSHHHRRPHPRFFKTDVGEVLQFDVDGEEGKEMLLRRYIQDQKSRQHEFPSQHPSSDYPPLQPQHCEESMVHELQVPNSHLRPKAAAGDRRKARRSRSHEILEEVEDEDASVFDSKIQKSPIRRKDRTTKSKSKSRSRSRESEFEEDGNDDEAKKKQKRKREKSKSPAPPTLITIHATPEENRRKGRRSSSPKSNDPDVTSISPRPIFISQTEISKQSFERHGMDNEGNTGRQSSIGMGNLLIPDQLNHLEDDEDSGIGLLGMSSTILPVGIGGRSKMLEKKSIFTIAYDDMATGTVLRPDTGLNPSNGN